MKFELIQKVELSAAQVQKIVADFVKDHLDIESPMIEVENKTGTRTVGHQMNEHQEFYFDGMTVSFNKRID